MGEIITFRCAVCGSCWIAGGEGLRRLSVYRASISGETESEPLYLPFWAVPVDTGELARSLEEGMKRLAGGPGVSSPAASEIRHLAEEIGPGRDLDIYVPCFPSPDPMACLKAGRLMTRARPSFHAERTDFPGPSPACTLLPEEALKVIDYIFYSTLPGHIRRCASLIEGIHLAAASAPVLVEFPFVGGRGSLHSLIGDFHVPGRLLGAVEV